jgi:hypothetical protein
MIKTTVNNQKDISTNKYPCLMLGKKTGNVYLMSSKNEGTRLAVGPEAILPCKVSFHSYMINSEQLTLFTGTVTLENEK